MTLSHSFDPIVPSAAQRERFNPLGPVHKAIRLALCDLLARTGQADFESAPVAEALRRDLQQVLDFCEGHADLEDRSLAPALEGRVRGALGILEEGHPRLRRMIQELLRLGEAVARGPLEARARTGRILYGHLAEFTAENLAHMAEEEHSLVPLLQRHYSDGELKAIGERAVATLPEDMRRYSMVWILRASNRAEREALVSESVGKLPGAAVSAMLRAAAASIGADELTGLLARCNGGSA